MRLTVLLLALFWMPLAHAQTAPRLVLAAATDARTPTRPAALPRVPRASAAALASARRYLCPNGGTPQGRGRCMRGPGIGAGFGGGTGMMGDDPELRDWDQGLAPPNRAQAPCPPGTTASQARAQPGVTRCIAG